MQRGYFISFEGSEGSGKSTQIIRLAKRLQALQKTVLLTREPGGTPLSESIRKLLKDPTTGIVPQAELLLFAASRAQLLQELIFPALKMGTIVLSDRFTDSTLAYQGSGRKMDLAFIQQLNHFTTQGLVPDCTILLDIPPEVGLQRAKARQTKSMDRLEQEDLSFYKAVRSAYLELAKTQADRFIVIQADQDPDTIEDSIWHALSQRLRC